MVKNFPPCLKRGFTPVPEYQGSKALPFLLFLRPEGVILFTVIKFLALSVR